jgi:hypothetical protein
MAAQSWTDERIEIIIGGLLRAGVILAAAIVSVGGIVYLVRHGSEPADYRIFHVEPSKASPASSAASRCFAAEASSSSGCCS